MIAETGNRSMMQQSLKAPPLWLNHDMIVSKIDKNTQETIYAASRNVLLKIFCAVISGALIIQFSFWHQLRKQTPYEIT